MNANEILAAYVKWVMGAIFCYFAAFNLIFCIDGIGRQKIVINFVVSFFDKVLLICYDFIFNRFRLCFSRLLDRFRLFYSRLLDSYRWGNNHRLDRYWDRNRWGNNHRMYRL